MGINISVLTPLAAPLAVQPVTAAVMAETRPQPNKVAAAGGASQAGVRTGSGQAQHQPAPEAKSPAAAAASGMMPKSGAAAAQAAVQAAGEAAGKAAGQTVAVATTSANDSAEATASTSMARQRLALAEGARATAGPAQVAARQYEESTETLDQAKSFADRVGLLPEPGDLALSFSEMPPYAGREAPSPATLTSPQAETIARA